MPKMSSGKYKGKSSGTGRDPKEGGMPYSKYKRPQYPGGDGSYESTPSPNYPRENHHSPKVEKEHGA